MVKTKKYFDRSSPNFKKNLPIFEENVDSSSSISIKKESDYNSIWVPSNLKNKEKNSPNRKLRIMTQKIRNLSKN